MLSLMYLSIMSFWKSFKALKKKKIPATCWGRGFNQAAKILWEVWITHTGWVLNPLEWWLATFWNSLQWFPCGLRPYIPQLTVPWGALSVTEEGGRCPDEALVLSSLMQVHALRVGRPGLQTHLIQRMWCWHLQWQAEIKYSSSVILWPAPDSEICRM